MAVEIAEYHEELFQEIHGLADADGRFVEDAFFEVFTAALTDAGEIETADRVHHIAPRGIRVDGYGGDPAVSDGVLSLIIADFNQTQEIATLTATDMNATFRRLSNFLERSLDEAFRNSLEESAPAFGLADLIAARWPSVSRVRLFLISNRVLSSRIDGREAGELHGSPRHLQRLGPRTSFIAMPSSGHEREDLMVSLDEFGGPLVVLPAHMEHADYESYLAVFPGSQLARIYDRWGARLLEQNVRVFLQARGNVNRGIRNTIANDPEMFFAYNNGITATAESMETVESPNGLLLTSMRNFQIVNGGTDHGVHTCSTPEQGRRLGPSLRADEALHRRSAQGIGDCPQDLRVRQQPEPCECGRLLLKSPVPRQDGRVFEEAVCAFKGWKLPGVEVVLRARTGSVPRRPWPSYSN